MSGRTKRDEEVLIVISRTMRPACSQLRPLTSSLLMASSSLPLPALKYLRTVLPSPCSRSNHLYSHSS